MWSNARIQTSARRFFALFAAVSVSAVAAHAQSIATLKGRITDASGAVVRGAMITLRDEDTGGQHSGTSDAAGEGAPIVSPPKQTDNLTREKHCADTFTSVRGRRVVRRRRDIFDQQHPGLGQLRSKPNSVHHRVLIHRSGPRIRR